MDQALSLMTSLSHLMPIEAVIIAAILAAVAVFAWVYSAWTHTMRPKPLVLPAVWQGPCGILARSIDNECVYQRTYDTQPIYLPPHLSQEQVARICKEIGIPYHSVMYHELTRTDVVRIVRRRAS